MKIQIASKALWLLAFTLGAGTAAHAASVVDAPNDLIPTYAGAMTGDLDVLSAFVNYNPGTDTFAFSGTFAAAVGTTPSAIYVFGLDRGQGTERLNTGAVPVGAGVKFDSVVVFNQNGSATVTTFGPAPAPVTTVLPGVVSFSGDTIFGSIDGSLLASTGFDKNAYTWNLWPRDPTAAGNTAISDFAPDASNASVAPVPEPETYALMGLGLGLVAWVSRRRRAGRV